MRPGFSQDHPLFFLSRFSQKAVEIDAFFSGLQDKGQSVDFQQLCALAGDNGVAGFLYNTLKNRSDIPELVKRQLQGIYRRTTLTNLHQVAETVQLLKLFTVAGIRIIPLKGVVASELFFHDLGVYPSGDIDVLIHPDDLEAVVELLKTQTGYSPVPGHSEQQLLAGHYHYMFYNDRYLLEVHWKLAKRYFEVPADFWWHRAEGIRWRDMEILQPAPEKYLMYAIFRLFDHCFYPLRFLALIAGILDTHGSDLDWEGLIRDCRRYKMERITIFTLQLVHEVFAVDVPAHIMARRIFGSSSLHKLFLSGILNGVERKHLRMMAYMLLLDSPAAVLKALLGRLVPGRDELCLRYNLSPESPRVYLYYVLNPVLLFFKGK